MQLLEFPRTLTHIWIMRTRICGIGRFLCAYMQIISANAMVFLIIVEALAATYSILDTSAFDQTSVPRTENLPADLDVLAVRIE